MWVELYWPMSHCAVMKDSEYHKLYRLEDRHWWYVGHYHIYAKLLELHCPAEVRGKVLDAGCGTGGFMNYLRERYDPQRLVGVDISEEALGFCARRGLKDTRLCSVEELPFGEGYFDLVISLDVLYHARVLDDIDALRELARVTKKGGYLLLNLPAFPILRGRHDVAVEGARRYRKREVEEKLKKTGFTPIRISYSNFFLFPVMLLYRLWSRWFPGDEAEPVSDLSLPPQRINQALSWLLRLESKMIVRFPLPWGGSLTALARKL